MAVEPREFTVDMEITLLQSISKFRPLGVHKHFQLINITKAFNKSHPTTPPVTSSDIWTKITSMYDIDGLDSILDEQESDDDLPLDARRKRSTFPFEFQNEFNLPSNEYEELLMAKRFRIDDSDASYDSPDDEKIERRGRPKKEVFIDTSIKAVTRSKKALQK